MSDRELSPADLMAAIESPAGFDPMPVEHHQFPAKYPGMIDKHVVQLMSVIYSHTIRKGHRSPVAVDGAGKFLTIEHIADKCGWSVDWAKRQLAKAIAAGLVRRGTGKKGDSPPTSIRLVGRVKPQITQPLTLCSDSTQSVCTLRDLRTFLSESEYAQCEKFDQDKLERIAAAEESEAKLDERIIADAVWQARQFCLQRKYNRLRAEGIEPDPPREKRRKEPPIVAPIQLSLQLETAGVHSAAGNGVYTALNGSVHGAVSLLGFPEGYSPEKDSKRAAAEGGAGAPPSYVGEVNQSAAQSAAPPPSLALVKSATAERFENWRRIRNGCKKPVPDENLELRRQCLAIFASYGPAEQDQIVIDTAARIDSYNAESKLHFVPTAVAYLNSRIWRTDPVQYVQKVSKAQSEREDFYGRAIERARERDRIDPRRRQ